MAADNQALWFHRQVLYGGIRETDPNHQIVLSR